MMNYKPNGIANAIILSSSLGVFVIGLLTTLAEINEHIKNLLNWYNPVGPLCGVTGMGVFVWLISWSIFHFLWREKNLDFSKVWVVSLILIALGLILTFPPVFDTLGEH